MCEEKKNEEELEYLISLILSDNDEHESQDESKSSNTSTVLTSSSSSNSSASSIIDSSSFVAPTKAVSDIIPAPKTKKSRKPQQSTRKPSYRIPFIPSLRILKRDIRRKYIDMFFLVMNSHDERLFSSFVDEFYLPQCLAEHTFTMDSSYCLYDLHLQGTELIKQLHRINCRTMPDARFLMSNNKICKRLHENGSRIIGNFQSSGTAIYIPKNAYKEIYTTDLMKRLSLQDKNETIEFELAEEPLKIDLGGTYTIELDENHRFVSVSFIASECEVNRSQQREKGKKVVVLFENVHLSFRRKDGRCRKRYRSGSLYSLR